MGTSGGVTGASGKPAISVTVQSGYLTNEQLEKTTKNAVKEAVEPIIGEPWRLGV